MEFTRPERRHWQRSWRACEVVTACTPPGFGGLRLKTLRRVDPNNLRFFFSRVAISVLEVRLKEERVTFADGDLLALDIQFYFALQNKSHLLPLVLNQPPR